MKINKSLLFSMLIIVPLMACANNDYLKNPEYIEAQNGNVDAQYNIAMNYLNEIDGFPKDNKKALYWFTQAANQGDIEAYNSLGIMYVRGFGTAQDLVKSEYYFKLAAEQGHGNGQVQMGRILLKNGDAKSKEEAIVWLEKAAQQNNEQAIEILQEVKNSDLKRVQ